MTPHERAEHEATGCPEAAALEAFGRGERPSTPEAEHLETHVAGCHACREFLDDIEGAAELGALIREARSDVPHETRERIVHSTIVMLSQPGGATDRGAK